MIGGMFSFRDLPPHAPSVPRLSAFVLADWPPALRSDMFFTGTKVTSASVAVQSQVFTGLNRNMALTHLAPNNSSIVVIPCDA